MRTADARVWHLAAIGFTMANGLYAMSFWIPQLVRSFFRLYSNTVVGFQVMIPHLVGLVAILLVSGSSDRNLER
jgi:ACS family tartrate transporter-like MFS transporter